MIIGFGLFPMNLTVDFGAAYSGLGLCPSALVTAYGKAGLAARNGVMASSSLIYLFF